jgi:hypothetical protein
MEDIRAVVALRLVGTLPVLNNALPHKLTDVLDDPLMLRNQLVAENPPAADRAPLEAQRKAAV